MGLDDAARRGGAGLGGATVSGAGGLRAGISGISGLCDFLEYCGGGKAAGRAAAKSGLPEEIAKASVEAVNAAERARFLRQERADGGSWKGPPWMGRRTALIRKGELLASMSSYQADGAKLVGTMAEHGRYHNPPDYWPAPVPAAVRKIFFEQAQRIIAEGIAASMGRAA